jgi:ACT domain-containing protein
MKIRLMGLPEECEEILRRLERSSIRVISVSREYQNRKGNTNEVRMYLEVEVKDESK